MAAIVTRETRHYGGPVSWRISVNGSLAGPTDQRLQQKIPQTMNRAIEIAEIAAAIALGVTVLPVYIALCAFLLLARIQRSWPYSYRPPLRMWRLGWGRRYPHNIKGMPRRRSGGASQPGPTY